MFVPQARIKLGSSQPGWFGGKSKTQRLSRQKLKWYEFVRMPCLVPNVVGCFVGFIVICSGALLCYIGYNPDKFFNNSSSFVNRNTTTSNDTTYATITPMVTITEYTPLTYVGPVLMGIGFFVLIVAVVLYCEIRDKFIQNIIPKRNVADLRKRVLYDMVINEFRKNYFRGIEVPLKPKRKLSNKIASEMPTLYKALSISTPAILITPEVQRRWKRETALTPKNKRRRRMGDNETWLKTSSMPNIRPKSFKRLQRRFSKHSKFNPVKLDITKMGLNKNNEEVIDDIESNRDNSDTCFSNPAFRGSPPEPIELDDITTNLQTEQAEIPNKSNVTHVVVHIDSDEIADDARGFTERRHSDISNSLSIEREVKQDKITFIPDISSQFDMIPDIYCRDGASKAFGMSKTNKGRHKSFDHLDIGLKGPYKTCIGVFRSESCLHRIRNIVNKSDHGDGDNSSLDSLTLNDEIMKNFENPS